jgi:hypothetical protein
VTARVLRWKPKIDPQLLDEAKYCPLLAYMIEHGIPLTREKYISMSYLGHPPDPWTAEHEAELPTPFRLGEEEWQ